LVYATAAIQMDLRLKSDELVQSLVATWCCPTFVENHKPRKLRRWPYDNYDNNYSTSYHPLLHPRISHCSVCCGR